MNNTSRGSSGARRFGAFGGVFTPSILTILGVILFMRANSTDADLIMLGFIIPDEPEKPIFIPSVETMLNGLPPMLLVFSTGEVDARE